MTRAGFTLTWDDANDAKEVAHVLMSAALDKRGRIRDHGFHQDAQSLLAQVEAAERDEEFFDA